MYTTFFDLRELPFSHTNDLRFFFPTPTTRSVEERINAALHKHSGLILLTGDPGTGKTTLLRRILNSSDDNIRIISLPFSAARFDDVLSYLCSHFGIDSQGHDPLTKVLAIQEHLRTWAQRGFTTVLSIDEAQHLLKETLDRLRLLLHLRGPTGKLLQILLVGQPWLETKLAHPDLRHLQQYVTAHCHLNPLSPEAVPAFIAHRLHVAGCDRRDLFSYESLQRITHYSQAVPQLINVLCDNSLLTAYMAGSHTVTSMFVEEVAENLQLASPDPLLSIPQDQSRPIDEPPPLSIRPLPKREPSVHQGWAYNFAWASVGVFCAWLSSVSSSSLPLPFFTAPSSTSGLSPSLAGTPALVETVPQLPQSQDVQPTQMQPLPLLQNQQQAAPPIELEQPTPVAPLPPPLPAAQTQPPLPTVPPRNATKPTEAAPHQRVKEHLLASETKVQTVSRPRIQEEATVLGLQPSTTATPERLFRATRAGNVHEVKRFLQTRGPINIKDRRGWTALMIAAHDNQPDIVRVLLTHGANVNTTNREGETALIYAADNNHLAIVQMLLEHGAAIDKKSKLGWTALTYAAAKGHRHTVEALLSKGADPNVRDNAGHTASAYALRQGSVASLGERLRAPSSFRSYFDRGDADKREWLKRHEYREVTSMLRQAERK